MYGFLIARPSLSPAQGLITSANLPAFTSTLVKDITQRYSNHVSVGIIGAKALFPTLEGVIQHATALSLAEQTSYPSWGYMLYNDVEPANSSVWEVWQLGGDPCFS